MRDEELTPSERDAVEALPRTAQPSDLLEERTVQALAARGLLRPRQRIPAPVAWIGAVAACVVFFVAGFGVGASRTERRAHEKVRTHVPSDTASSAAMEPSSGVAQTGSAATPKGPTQVVVWF